MIMGAGWGPHDPGCCWLIKGTTERIGMRDVSALQRSRVWMFAALMWVAIAPSGGAGPTAHALNDVPRSLSLPPGWVTFGVHAGDQQFQTSGDVLLPLCLHQNDLVFMNPRGAWNDDEGQQVNVGFGTRHLFPDKNFILGGNLYYDRCITALGNTFNQGGGGVEFLSPWFDARLNGYLPEHRAQIAEEYVVTSGTTRKQAEYWDAPVAHGHTISQSGYAITEVYQWTHLQHYQTAERAMSGFDVEIGSRLPIPLVMDYAEVKTFAGYYSFSAHDGGRIAGMKARLEVCPVQAVCLDACWYEDEKLMGSRYSIGLRATLPFDLARLSRGLNPFTGALAGFRERGAQASFHSRLTEQVVRDHHVKTEVSAPREIVQDRRQLAKSVLSHERHDYTEILASEVTFVSGDNQSGVEDGTWEQPYRQINIGVENAIGSMVYVDKASRPYVENVALQDGIILWGSGAPLCGPHGSFQGGRYPVVNGSGTVPAVTLANQSTVAGFELMQPAGGPGASPVIYGRNVSGVTIVDNTIHGHGVAVNGISLSALGQPSLDAAIWNNRVMGSRDAGIVVRVVSVPRLNLVLAGNTVTDNGGDGVCVSAVDAGDFRVRLSGRYSGNGGFGVNLAGNPILDADVGLQAVEMDGNEAGGLSLILQSFSGAVAVSLLDVTANDNSGDGLFVDIYGYDGVETFFGSITAEHNLSNGIDASWVSGGMIRGAFMGNKLFGNGEDGLALDLNSGLDSRIVGRGNYIAGNRGNGMSFRTLAPWDSLYDFGALEAGMNRFYGNGTFQVLFDGVGTLSAAGNWWGGALPLDGVEYQSMGGGLIEALPALPLSPEP